MKKILQILLLTSIAAIVVVGCSKKEAASDSILYLANGAEPGSLDPQKVEGTVGSDIAKALFEGLTINDPVDAHAIPGVAESWDISDDAKMFTFHIRKDAMFSDGTPITAQTVYDSWVLELAPESAAPYAYLPASFIKGGQDFNSGKVDASALGLKVVDDYTFQVSLVGPTPFFAEVVTHQSFAIVPIDVIKEFGAGWVKPENFVGNGPYVLSEWVPQDHIRVKKSPTYWDRDNVQVEELVYFATSDGNTAFQMYENGEVDVLLNSPVPSDRLEGVKNRPDYHKSAQYGTYYYSFNNAKPEMKDVRVRKALSMAVDRQILVERVLNGGQIPTLSFVPPMAGYTPPVNFDSSKIQENIAEAKQLLADAGFPNGKGFPEITVIYNTNEGHKKIAEFIQEQWKQNLNVNIKLANYEWKTFLQVRDQGDFVLARNGWLGDYLDPSTFLDLLTDTSDQNDGNYDNAEYNRLMKQAASAPLDERYGLFMRAETIMLDDAGVMPLYFYTSEKMFDPEKVGGITLNVLKANNPKFFRKLK